MGQLPYGSQTRLFRELWARLRAADKSEEAVKSEMASAGMSDFDISLSTDNRQPGRPKLEQDVLHDDDDAIDPMQTSDDDAHRRDPNLPECDDPETKQVLLDAETNWDPAANDHLILPRDRHLVSDYVFLVMRQIKVISSDYFDSQRRRLLVGTGCPGLACVHCLGQDQGISPVGRTFPSAADNFASALNTSLYNHMQACLCVPDAIKRALANTRKVHSAQCASIKFGSQRRYFNLLFERLTNASFPNAEGESNITKANTFLQQHRFIEIPCDNAAKAIVICNACRMVPIQFRARDSTFIGKPRLDFVRLHHSLCKKSSLDLEQMVDVLDETLPRASGGNEDEDSELNVLASESFAALVRAALAGESRLTNVFTNVVRDLLLRKRSGAEFESNHESYDTMGDLWMAFPTVVDVSSVHDAFCAFAQKDGKKYCVSDRLSENVQWGKYLSLISPSLTIPNEGEGPTAIV